MLTLGFAFGYSDVSTIDEKFPHPSSQLHVPGSSGEIVYQNTAGDYQYFPEAQSGVFYPISAVKIVTSATVNGILRTTTATEIVYCSSGNPQGGQYASPY